MKSLIGHPSLAVPSVLRDRSGSPCSISRVRYKFPLFHHIPRHIPRGSGRTVGTHCEQLDEDVRDCHMVLEKPDLVTMIMDREIDMPYSHMEDLDCFVISENISGTLIDW